MVGDGRLEGAVGERLEAQIDRQVDVVPGPGGTHVLDVLHAAAEAVLDDLLGPRDPAKHRVVRELHPFLPLPVDVGEADDVGGDLRLGVVAPELALEVDPRDGEGPGARRGVRVDVAAQVHEGALGAFHEPRVEPGRVETDRRGQLGPALAGVDRFARVHPYGLDGGAHGERGAVAVPNHSARGMRAHRADVPRGPLVAQEIPLVHLQVQGLAEQSDRAHREHRHHQADPPPERQRANRPAQPFDTDPWPLRLRNAHDGQYSRLTMAMRPGSGRSIPRRRSASLRTRSWEAR